MVKFGKLISIVGYLIHIHLLQIIKNVYGAKWQLKFNFFNIYIYVAIFVVCPTELYTQIS